MKTKLAHFPVIKTLDGFDFAFQPPIDERQIRELATLRFVNHGETLLLLGPPETGKTHLAIALGMLAISQGMSVYSLTVAALLDIVQRDAKEDRLAHRLQAFYHPNSSFSMRSASSRSTAWRRSSFSNWSAAATRRRA